MNKLFIVNMFKIMNKLFIVNKLKYFEQTVYYKFTS